MSSDTHINNPAKAKASVDYLTATSNNDKATANLLHQLYDCLGPDRLHEYTWRPWRFKGFSGRSTEGVRYGVRGEEGIAILSGSRAAAHWAEIAGLATNITRIDLALTVEFDVPMPHLAREFYREAMESGNANYGYVTSTRGGSTLYVGSRTSQFYGRLYDKSAEQGEESGKVWRWEVEVKKPKAKMAISTLIDQESPAEWIHNYIHAWFTMRGIECPQPGLYLDTALEIGAIVKTTDKTIAWLRSQVKPAVHKLITSGFRDQVQEALGLNISINQPLLWQEGDK